MSKCLRCGAGSEWIEGRSPRCDQLHDVDAEEISRLQAELAAVNAERDGLKTIIDEANAGSFHDAFSRYMTWLNEQTGGELSHQEQAMIEACRDASLVLNQRTSELAAVKAERDGAYRAFQEIAGRCHPASWEFTRCVEAFRALTPPAAPAFT